MDNDVFSLKDSHALYRALGVEQGASDAAIKKAYHKLAMQFHPDKNPAGADRFKEISFAYNILSDPEQRKMYDNKTLRTHIEGERAKDPDMDPTVELSPEDLQRFVEKLRRQQNDAEQSRRDFEDRRQSEQLRREEFDRLHPGFRMPDMGALASKAVERQQRTSAEVSSLLSRLEAPSTSSATDENGGLGSIAASSRGASSSSSSAAASASSTKSQMLEQFRTARQQRGLSTTRVVEPNVDEATASRLKGRAGVASGKEEAHYEYDSEKIKSKRGDFDYCRFVVAGYHDGGVLREAILADSLDRYSAE